MLGLIQYGILSQLTKYPKGLRNRDLLTIMREATDERINQPDLSKSIGRLVKQGLVSKCREKWQLRFFITEEGSEVFNETKNYLKVIWND